MVDQIFYLLSAVLLGTVIGALIMYFVSNNKKDNNPEAAIAEVENKLKNYQEEVSSHFEETADLIDDLTQSYKKVFDHMSKSAKQLMSEEQIQLQIEKRKGNKVTLAFLNEEDSDELDAVADEAEQSAETDNAELDGENTEHSQHDESVDQSETDSGSNDHSDGSKQDEIQGSDGEKMASDNSSENVTVTTKAV